MGQSSRSIFLRRRDRISVFLKEMSLWSQPKRLKDCSLPLKFLPVTKRLQNGENLLFFFQNSAQRCKNGLPNGRSCAAVSDTSKVPGLLLLQPFAPRRVASMWPHLLHQSEANL